MNALYRADLGEDRNKGPDDLIGAHGGLVPEPLRGLTDPMSIGAP